MNLKKGHSERFILITISFNLIRIHTASKQNQAVADNNAETDTSYSAKEHEQQTELKFRQMMDNPEGDLYKQCFDRLNDFAKKKAVKGGPAFEGAMLSVFKEVMEISDAGNDQNIGDQNNPPAAEGN